MLCLAAIAINAQPIDDLENPENVQAVEEAQDDQEGSDLEGAESRYGGWGRGYGGWGKEDFTNVEVDLKLIYDLRAGGYGGGWGYGAGYGRGKFP